VTDAETEPNGQDDLDRCPDQSHLLDRLEVFERELEAEGEQQESHSNFGKPLDVVDVGDGETACVGSQNDTGSDVAEDHGLPEALQQYPAAERNYDEQDYVSGYSHALSCVPPFYSFRKVPVPASEFSLWEW